MTGEWIKWTKGLTTKREVVAMARKLKLSRRETAATLMEVWEWADSNSEDGHVPGVTETFIDELVNVKGFGRAMTHEAGWLLVDNTGITFPNFARHNGKSAKQRALAAERKRLQREQEDSPSRNGNGHRVTEA